MVMKNSFFCKAKVCIPQLSRSWRMLQIMQGLHQNGSEGKRNVHSRPLDNVVLSAEVYVIQSVAAVIRLL